jgi:hypothetical protein
MAQRSVGVKKKRCNVASAREIREQLDQSERGKLLPVATSAQVSEGEFTCNSIPSSFGA